MPSRYTSTGRVLALGGLTYRQALLTTTPTYAWIAEDLAAGAVAAWPCAVTGVQATQATAGARPTQSATALNSRPGLTFDGGDVLQTGAFTVAQPFVVVVATQRTGAMAGSALQILYDGLTNAGRGVLYHNATTGHLGIFSGTALQSTTATTSPTILRATHNGATSSLVLNGTEIASGNAGTTGLDGLTLGRRFTGTDFLTGIIADILIFSGADYAARAASADALMRAYYGI
jgi:hypothetical protein